MKCVVIARRTMLTKWNWSERITTHHVVETPFNQTVTVFDITLPRGSIGFLPRYGLEDRGGRYEVSYKANIFAVKSLGTERVIGVGSVGAIAPLLQVGDIVVPHDFIDFTRQRPRTFLSSLPYGGFIRMNPPFCPEIRLALGEASTQAPVRTHDSSVYACVDGPRLETPSEVQMFKLVGCTIVGMPIATEAILARELEVCYGAICFVTNAAEGTIPYTVTPSTDGLVPDQSRDAEEKTRAVLGTVVETALSTVPLERGCICKDAQIDSKADGLLSTDWREWFHGAKE